MANRRIGGLERFFGPPLKKSRPIQNPTASTSATLQQKDNDDVDIQVIATVGRENVEQQEVDELEILSSPGKRVDNPDSLDEWFERDNEEIDVKPTVTSVNKDRRREKKQNEDVKREIDDFEREEEKLEEVNASDSSPQQENKPFDLKSYQVSVKYVPLCRAPMSLTRVDTRSLSESSSSLVEHQQDDAESLMGMPINYKRFRKAPQGHANPRNLGTTLSASQSYLQLLPVKLPTSTYHVDENYKKERVEE